MAAAEQSSTRKYSALLSLCTVGSMFILVFMWFWVKDYPLFSWPQRFRVRFHHVNGLANSAGVLINGVRVGSVEGFELLGPREVSVAVRIKRPHVVVPEGSQFSIYPNGLMGPECLNIELPMNMEKRQPLDDKSIVYGIDPPKGTVVDKLANKLESIDPAEIRKSFHRMGSVIAAKISVLNSKLSPVADHTIVVENRMSAAADRISDLSTKLIPAATRATLMEDNVSLLATDLRGVSHRVNHLLGDSKSRGDLIATSENAKEAAEHFDNAMTRLQETVGDKSARDEFRQMMDEFDDSSQNIQLATAHLTQFGADPQLRTDVKEIVCDARKTVETVKDIVKKPAFGSDVHSTLSEAKRLMKKMELVATQLHQILDKRAPLLKMLFSRPGHLEPASVAGQQQQCE